MGRIRKGVVWRSARATRLMVTLALVVGLVVPISGGALAAVDGDPGTTLNPFTQTELDDNWEADRYFPTAGVTSVSAFGRDDVARLGIDTTDTQPGTFQRTEGIKTVGTGFFGRSVQVDLYLDPDWADKAVRAGVWVVGDDGTGARDDVFGIIEFLNMEPCPEPDCTNPTNIPPSAFEGFRVYDSTIGWSEYLTTPFTYGEWVTLEITLDAAAEEYVYVIDGVEVATAPGGSHFISEVFLNSYNFGLDSFPELLSDDYAAHWHVGSESDIAWTTEKVYPGDMNDWAFGFDSGADGSGALVWGPGLPPVGGGSAFFELGDAATGYVIGTPAHGAPGTPFMDITALEYSTYRSAGDPAEAVALQFNVDYDLTDTTTSWQGRLVYEPYYTQTVLDDTWQTWDTLATGANWWSTGTPQVGNAADTKHCTIGAPCTWEEVLTHYPDAGIHELPLAGMLLKAGSGWAGFEGNADELKIATGTTGTIFDFDPYAGGNCVVDASGGGDFLLLEPAIDAQACTTIEVRAGAYVEEGQVVIDRDVTIIGDDRATTIFKTDSDTASSGDARGWFLVSSGDVHISNVTFDGTGHKVWQAFRHLGTGSFDNVGFQNIGYNPSGPDYSGVAIAAFGGIGAVDVTNSVFSQIGRIGVLYYGAGQTGTFANNMYTGKGVGDWLDYALDISAGAVVDIDDNTITMNRGTASSDGSGSAAILVSTFFGAGTVANISGNTLDDNSVGVAIGYDGSDSSEATMTGNTITNNDFGITLTSDDAAAASSANRNAIEGNGTGVDNDGTEVFDATCNWWGDASGPDGTYGGSGDSIVGPADELPWLKSADLAGPCTGGFPVIDGIVDIEVEDQEDPGEVVEYTPTATSVIDGAVPVTCDPVSGSTFFIGETEVECEATDSEGNTATETFTVTVLIVAGPALPEQVGLVDTMQGRWHLRDSAGDLTSFYFGNPGDFPFTGDWDCDTVDTPGLYRQSDGRVYLKNTNKAGPADVVFYFGNPGDIPIPGDFNDDGCDTVSLYRPSTGQFFIINELGANGAGLGAADFSFMFGNLGDRPFAGDFDGDGDDTVGLHRESTGLVYFKNTLSGGAADGSFLFGNPDDVFFAGDWNANGGDSAAVFRPGNTTFYFRNTNTTGNADSMYEWDLAESGWMPVSGQWGLEN